MASASHEHEHERADDRCKRWWTALAGTLLFALIGVALVPGLARREPAPVREPGPPAAAPERAERASATPAAGAAATAPAAAPAGAAPESPSAAPVALEIDAFDCMILASEAVEVGSPVTGRIEEIPVERGDAVEAGQVVARLDSEVERAAVRVARARARSEGAIEFAEANLELGRKRRQRAVELFERDSLSLDERQQVETEADLAASELKRARENHRVASLELDQALAALARRTIRSPTQGFVVERLMAPGEVAVDETTILRIARTDPLRVELVLPSGWFGRVRPGDRAEVTPEAPLDTPRSAEVSIVDPVIDGASGTFGARLLLPNPDHELPAGLRCQLRFLDDPAEPDEMSGGERQP